MAIPAGIATVVVSGRYIRPDGSPLTGTVTFEPPARLTFPDADTISAGAATVALDTEGAFTLELIATDVPGMQPEGWTYTVTERMSKAPERTYYIALPSATPAVDLADIAPADPAHGDYVLITGPAGKDGMDGADGADGSKIYSGTGAPPAETGVPGDYYVDTTTGAVKLYGPKDAAGWPATGVTLGSGNLVTSVNSKTGAVALMAADVNALPITGGTVSGSTSIQPSSGHALTAYGSTDPTVYFRVTQEGHPYSNSLRPTFYNIGVGDTGTPFAGGKFVLGMKNALTVPTETPVNGAVMYAEGGRVKVLQSDGVGGVVPLLDPSGKVPLSQLPKTAPYAAWSDLDGASSPRWIAHRGAALVAPENTIEAYRLATELGADAIEVDVYLTADGGLAVMHDTTPDRTSNLSGISTSALTMPAVMRGRVDAGNWFANTWPNDLRIPTFADVLAEVGNRVPLVVHCNNTGSGAAAVAALQRQELTHSALIMAWNEAELAAARTAGIPTVLLDADGVLSGQTYAGLIAAGTRYLGVDHSQATTATINAAAAAGLRVIVYTVNRRADYTKLPTASVWAVVSDDPWYVKGTGRMRTSDQFASQSFSHGMPGIVDAGDYRGFYQTPAWWGLDASGEAHAANGGYVSVLHGYLGPLGNTFTMDFDFVIDTIDYATASLQVAFTVGDVAYDDDVVGTAAKNNGYNILIRTNGTIDVYRVASGTSTSIGTVSTAAITAGSAQHLRVQMTSTQLIVTRTNIATPNAVTCTDSTYRGGLYPHIGVRDVKARVSALSIP